MDRLTDEQINTVLRHGQDRDKISLDRNSPLWGLFLVLESALCELRTRREFEANESELDGTDGAHPAWWRGHDASCARFCDVWEKALNGEPLVGVYGDERLTQLYRRTLELCK